MNKFIYIFTLIFLGLSQNIHANYCQWGDCKNGKGLYKWTDGDSYEGQFKNGYRHGVGTYIFPSGNSYEGQWVEGKQDGRGTFTFNGSDSLRIEGKWSNGEIFEGKQFFRDGSIYEGEYKNTERNGLGNIRFARGDSYSGEFKDGFINGKGTFTYTSGARYVGEMITDDEGAKRHGLGINYFTDGTSEEGMYIKDEFSYPTEVFSDDSTRIVNEQQSLIDEDQIIPVSSGTAFAVTKVGHLVTNHHVIDGCRMVSLRFNGRDIPVDVLNFDPINDLALLKISRPLKNPYPINTNNAELMQEVYVAGYPFGDSLSNSVKITKGIVSSLTGLFNNFSNVQIDAALQPGNSGGPIFDNVGNIIGVAVAKVDLRLILENYGTIPENVNFGIKSSVLKDFLVSNNLRSLPSPNLSDLSNSDLGKKATDSTYYIGCYMTVADAKRLESEKVIYTDYFNKK